MVAAAVFAHPDDETFSIGGTIAQAAATGVRWCLFCATDGDAGRSSSIAVTSRAELATLRRNELIAAARALGVKGEIATAGYPDGELSSVDADRLIGDIVAFLRRTRPDLVITFGPEGAPNTHRDHRAISRAATAAFHLAGVPTAYVDHGRPHFPARLYYVTWPPPAATSQYPAQGLPAAVRIDVRSQLETKRRAFMIHATQRELLDRFEALGLTPEEWFAFAAGQPPRPDATDLFDGL